jgi:hypothetical protein
MRSSTIVVELDLERVKVLKLSGLRRHYLGMTFANSVVGVVMHYGWQPSDRSLHHLWSGEECRGGCGKMETLAPKCHRPPLLIWSGRSGVVIMGRLHLSIVVLNWWIYSFLSSPKSSLKFLFNIIDFWLSFGFHFTGERWPKKITPTHFTLKFDFL